ncbi:MAG: outer membrane lipoprotein carrier protein LolA [Rhodospirillaceae bacterium]|nr:outer membrane lipoprotein carrier protein LolA [Rhodospirillaceae bacterium]
MQMLIRAAALLCLAPVLAAWLTAVQPTPAQASDSLVLDEAARKTLAAVEGYLNGLQTLKADFTQVGPDGEPAEGVIYMRRPGLLRVEYAPPVPVLIVGDGFLIHYHDKELGQIDDWFIYDTPLGALTKEVTRFGEDVDVTAFMERGGRIGITVVQEDDPTGGSLTLFLDSDPLRLTHWRLRDAQGRATMVTLHNLRTNIRLPRRLFVFDDPRKKQTGRP